MGKKYDSPEEAKFFLAQALQDDTYMYMSELDRQKITEMIRYFTGREDRNVTIKFRLTEQEALTLRQMAQEEETNVSDLIRQKLFY